MIFVVSWSMNEESPQPEVRARGVQSHEKARWRRTRTKTTNALADGRPVGALLFGVRYSQKPEERRQQSLASEQGGMRFRIAARLGPYSSACALGASFEIPH